MKKFVLLILLTAGITMHGLAQDQCAGAEIAGGAVGAAVGAGAGAAACSGLGPVGQAACGGAVGYLGAKAGEWIGRESCERFGAGKNDASTGGAQSTADPRSTQSSGKSTSRKCAVGSQTETGYVTPRGGS